MSVVVAPGLVGRGRSAASRLAIHSAPSVTATTWSARRSRTSAATCRRHRPARRTPPRAGGPDQPAGLGLVVGDDQLGLLVPLVGPGPAGEPRPPHAPAAGPRLAAGDGPVEPPAGLGVGHRRPA